MFQQRSDKNCRTYPETKVKTEKLLNKHNNYQNVVYCNLKTICAVPPNGLTNGFNAIRWNCRRSIRKQNSNPKHHKTRIPPKAMWHQANFTSWWTVKCRSRSNMDTAIWVVIPKCKLIPYHHCSLYCIITVAIIILGKWALGLRRSYPETDVWWAWQVSCGRV